jgi:hypothetical protein
VLICCEVVKFLISSEYRLIEPVVSELDGREG